MKKLQILFFLLLTCIVTDAQILKGARLVGGQVNFRRTENRAPQNGSINSYGVIGLSIGKAYKENKVWGVNSARTKHTHHCRGWLWLFRN